MECKEEWFEVEDKVETRIWKSMGKWCGKYYMRKAWIYKVNKKVMKKLWDNRLKEEKKKSHWYFLPGNNRK